MDKKLLIAFDDSENAMRAVQMVAKHFSKDSKITLFNVVPDTAALCGMDSPALTPYFKAHQSSFCTLEEKKKELVVEAMEKALSVLIGAGFEKKNILIKTEVKKSGIARDILREAHSGYDVIVLGKKGISGVKDFILGSTSQKIFNAAKDLSVLVVN